jgi:uncharacterized protein (TIGR03086 family)
VDYTLDAVGTVTADLLPRPTPCAKWNLRLLLNHTSESVAALQEGLDRGRVGLFPMQDDNTAADPALVLRRRLTHLLEQWIAARDDRTIAVADQRIPLPLMARAAALELAVHGWDVYQASGHDRPIPPDLSADLLAISPQLIPHDNRHQLFASPIGTSASAGPGERLLAFLGRRSCLS